MRLLNTLPWQDVGEGGRWANSINNFSVIKIQKKKMIMKIWGKKKILYILIYVYQITSTTEKEVMQYMGRARKRCVTYFIGNPFRSILPMIVRTPAANISYIWQFPCGIQVLLLRLSVKVQVKNGKQTDDTQCHIHIRFNIELNETHWLSIKWISIIFPVSKW